MRLLKVALRLRTVALLGLTTLVVGCQISSRANPKQAVSGGQTYYAVYHFHSDPPGAHVYGATGNYMGVTKEKDETLIDVGRLLGGKPSQRGTIGIVYEWENQTGPRSRSSYVTLKKRGYPPTVHKFQVRYQYTSESDAAANPNKALVVLDTE